MQPPPLFAGKCASAVRSPWSLDSSGRNHRFPREVFAGLVAGSVLLVTFAVWQASAPSPMVPMELFRNRGFSVANVASLTMGFGMFGAVFFGAQYLQIVEGYGPLGAGLRLLPAAPHRPSSLRCREHSPTESNCQELWTGFVESSPSSNMQVGGSAARPEGHISPRRHLPVRYALAAHGRRRRLRGPQPGLRCM